MPESMADCEDMDSVGVDERPFISMSEQGETLLFSQLKGDLANFTEGE